MVLQLQGRLIDREERARQKPMRVLVLGMCRTGTSAMSMALRKLGYTPHQMREVLQNPKELELWQEAIETTLLSPADRPKKSKNFKPYGRPEFDKLLNKYDAVLDIPSCVFAKELIEAYPEAKVILTTRNYADWEVSMQDSIWCLCTWDLFKLARYFNVTQMAPLMRFMYSVFLVHNNNTYGGPESRAAFQKHYAKVRSLVPADNLLEIDPDLTTSWEPLCEFLGEEVPEERFPRTKEEKAMRGYLENAWWSLAKYCAGMLVLPLIVVLTAWALYTNADALRATRDEFILEPIGKFLKS
jgi:hypothetical protein